MEKEKNIIMMVLQYIMMKKCFCKEKEKKKNIIAMINYNLKVINLNGLRNGKGKEYYYDAKLIFEG